MYLKESLDPSCFNLELPIFGYNVYKSDTNTKCTNMKECKFVIKNSLETGPIYAMFVKVDDMSSIMTITLDNKLLFPGMNIWTNLIDNEYIMIKVPFGVLPFFDIQPSIKFKKVYKNDKIKIFVIRELPKMIFKNGKLKIPDKLVIKEETISKYDLAIEI